MRCLRNVCQQRVKGAGCHKLLFFLEPKETEEQRKIFIAHQLCHRLYFCCFMFKMCLIDLQLLMVCNAIQPFSNQIVLHILGITVYDWKMVHDNDVAVM